MKQCPYCNFENFDQQDYCEKCNKPLFNIPQEKFHFAEFIRKNFQLYSVIGVLVALSYYLVSLKNADVNFAIFILLLVAIYLILYLIQKGARIIKSRTWDDDKPFSKALSVFHYYFFVLFHLLLIGGLFYYIPENLRLFIAIIIGFFTVMTIHLQTLSKGNNPDLSLIVPITIVLFEIILILIFLIPFFAANVNDEIFAFYYLWSIPVLQYFIAGVMFGNLFAIIISADLSQKNSKISQLQIISEQKSTWISLLWGIVILCGIFLTSLVWGFFHP